MVISHRPGSVPALVARLINSITAGAGSGGEALIFFVFDRTAGVECLATVWLQVFGLEYG